MSSENGRPGSLSSNDEVLPRCGDDAKRSHSNHRHQYDRRYRSSRVASSKALLIGDGRTSGDRQASGASNRSKSRGRPSTRSSGSNSRSRSRLRNGDKQHSSTRRKRSSVTVYSTHTKSRKHRRRGEHARESCKHERRRCRSNGSQQRHPGRQRENRDRSRSSSCVKRDQDGYMVMDEGMIIRNRYRIVGILGEGTFGRVAQCVDLKRNSGKNVAVKVIKAVSRYTEAARLEIKVLDDLAREDPKGKHKCINVLDWFKYHGHMCISFELMGKSVFDFLKDNDYERYPFHHVLKITYQLSDAVNFLHNCTLTHTDLKPENILFVDSSYTVRTTRRGYTVKELRNPEIRLIDFGSATLKNDHHSTTVATRHYRPPEVVLEMGWSYPCDVWAIGCILYEIYTGQTMFMTHDNLEHLAMMERVLGPMPRSMIHKSRRRRFFRGDHLDWDWSNSAGRYVRRTLRPLERCHISDSKEDDDLINLTRDMLCYEPKRRITLEKALKHPFFRSLKRSSCESSDSRKSSSDSRSRSSFSDR